jgi:hypothetical protein
LSGDAEGGELDAGHRFKELGKNMRAKTTLFAVTLLALTIMPCASGLADSFHDCLGFYPPAAPCLQCHPTRLADSHQGNCWLCHHESYTLRLCEPASYPPDIDLTTICAHYQTEPKEPFTCGDCHVNAGDHAAAHVQVSPPSADCLDCHVADASAEHDRHGLGCSTCHDNPDPAVASAIVSGKWGNPVQCADCHGVIDHQTHRNAYEPCADCSGCHPAYSGLVADIINGHARKGVTCDNCHHSLDPNIQAVIDRGTSGTPIYCLDCHAQFGNHAHVHDMTSLASPECGTCHVANAVAEHHGHGPHDIGCLPCHNSAEAVVQNAIYNGMAGQEVPCDACHLTTGNRTPIANCGPDRLAGSGLPVQLSGAASYDHDGTVVGYQWDFGDGTPGGSGQTVPHTFAVPGTYTVGLTVTDDQGAVATDTVTLTVIPPAVTVEAVWTTDLTDAPKTVFKRGGPIRYHVRFQTLGGTLFTRAAGKAWNLSGTAWSRTFSKAQTLEEGTYHLSWDRVVPQVANRDSRAKVRIIVRAFDQKGGTLLGTSRKAVAFRVAR